MADGWSTYPHDWDERRRAVYRRDGYQCQNCDARGGSAGDTELHCHHIVPKSKGGSHDKSNLVTLCRDCHNRVHDQHIPEMSDVSNSQRQNAGSNKWVTRTTTNESSGPTNPFIDPDVTVYGELSETTDPIDESEEGVDNKSVGGSSSTDVAHNKSKSNSETNSPVHELRESTDNRSVGTNSSTDVVSDEFESEEQTKELGPGGINFISLFPSAYMVLGIYSNSGLAFQIAIFTLGTIALPIGAVVIHLLHKDHKEEQGVEIGARSFLYTLVTTISILFFKLTHITFDSVVSVT